MGFGILLMILFGLLAVGILIIIVCMLVIGLRRISRKSKSVEKPAPVKTNAETPSEPMNAQGTSPDKNNPTEKTP